MLRAVTISSIISITILVFLRGLFDHVLPPVWPDEALFSSTASSFAEGKGFITPVLIGLIPGMDEATLWNSPLYMVFLSLVYLVTGESLEAGRYLSLFFACAFLVLFSSALYRRTNRAAIAIIATSLVALDITFIRASNTIRMDTLALLFAYWSFITGKVDRPRAFRSGVLAGLAGLSHPIGIYTVLLLFVRYRFHWQSWARAIPGIFLVFIPWLIYISNHTEIFEQQFIAQMTRKADLAGIVESETGGSIRVYLSQYGGGFLSMWMLAIFLVVATVWQGLSMFQLARRNRKVSSYLWTRKITGAIESVLTQEYVIAFFGFLAVMAVVLLSSEGWYALHAGPFFIYSLALFVKRDQSGRSLKLFWIGCFVFLILPFMFYTRMNRSFDRYRPLELKASILAETNGCKRILVRSVPDPYFWLREHNENLQVFEFIPAKLRIEKDSSDLVETYKSMDCFLLNQHHDWNPHLKTYLFENIDRFEKTSITTAPPADSVLTLYRKNN